jgi:hypothetical protein
MMCVYMSKTERRKGSPQGLPTWYSLMSKTPSCSSEASTSQAGDSQDEGEAGDCQEEGGEEEDPVEPSEEEDGDEEVEEVEEAEEVKEKAVVMRKPAAADRKLHVVTFNHTQLKRTQ